MARKKYLQLLLVLGFIFVTLGGLMLHFNIHRIWDNPVNYVPFAAGLVSLLVLSVMFFFKKLVSYAYVLNGMLAIIGTVTMAHFSIARLMKVPPDKFTPLTPFMGTLLPDIFILWTAFFIGKLIFEMDLAGAGNLDQPRSKGRFFRYPNFGWWGVHLVTVSVVYTLGQVLWK